MTWSIEKLAIGLRDGLCTIVQQLPNPFAVYIPPTLGHDTDDLVTDDHGPGACGDYFCTENCSGVRGRLGVPLADWELELLGATRCPNGGICPPGCDHTQDGCHNVWGSDTEHAEAVARNRAIITKRMPAWQALQDMEGRHTDSTYDEPTISTATLDELKEEIRARFPEEHGSGAIDDGEPQIVTLTGREYERYLSGALNTPHDHPAEGNTDTEEPAWRGFQDISWKGNPSGSFQCMACHTRYAGAGSHVCPTLEGITDADHILDTNGNTLLTFGPNICTNATDSPATFEKHEPQLSDDELVAIRGLIQERYGDTEASPVGGSGDPPAGERAAGVEHPPAPPAAHPNVSWENWAIPAILAALDEHPPWNRICPCDPCYRLMTQSDWCDHVAPKIADAIGCCPEQAAAALLGQPDPQQ